MRAPHGPKGANDREVLPVHALRNAWRPLITTLGGTLPVLVGGSAVPEIVFAVPGIAPESLAAARAGDMPLVLAMPVITGTMAVAVCALTG